MMISLMTHKTKRETTGLAFSRASSLLLLSFGPSLYLSSVSVARVTLLNGGSFRDFFLPSLSSAYRIDVKTVKSFPPCVIQIFKNRYNHDNTYAKTYKTICFT